MSEKIKTYIGDEHDVYRFLGAVRAYVGIHSKTPAEKFELIEKELSDFEAANKRPDLPCGCRHDCECACTDVFGCPCNASARIDELVAIREADAAEAKRRMGRRRA